MEQVKKAAIVMAAGHGKRMHSKVAKQYLLLNGEPVLVHALRAFEMSGMDTIILVTGADEVEFCRKDIVEAYGFSSVKQVVPGGKERYDSVCNGLCALKAAGFPEDGIVLQLFCLRGSDAGKGYDQSGGRGQIFREHPGPQHPVADPDPAGIPV